MRRAVASALAVLAGFATTAVASTLADAGMRAADLFPRSVEAMTPGLFAIASGYRAALTVLGGYVTARLAPGRPMAHAAILAGIGCLAGIGGVVAFYAVGAGRLGPAWYAYSIPLQAVPCVLLGAWLAGTAEDAAE